MKKTFFILTVFVVFVAALFIFNARTSQAPTSTTSFSASPSPLPSPTATAPGSAAKTWEIDIAKNGVSTQKLLIKVGDTVTFVNQDAAPHWPASGAHPAHQICPGFDPLHALKTGENASFTFTVAKTCPFHDHLNAGLSQYQGQIIVQE